MYPTSCFLPLTLSVLLVQDNKIFLGLAHPHADTSNDFLIEIWLLALPDLGTLREDSESIVQLNRNYPAILLIFLILLSNKLVSPSLLNSFTSYFVSNLCIYFYAVEISVSFCYASTSVRGNLNIQGGIRCLLNLHLAQVPVNIMVICE